MGAGSATAIIALPASAEAVAFTVAGSWSTGYQAEVSVTNDTPVAIKTWQVRITLPAGTSVVNGWNATQSTGLAAQRSKLRAG